jgi:WD40 repeat protein
LEFPIDETMADAMDCHFSADGALLLSGNLTNMACNDVRTGARLGNVQGARITASAFDPLNNNLLLAATPGMFRFDHRISSRGRIALENQTIVHEGRGWRAFAFSQDGRWFAAANIYSNAAFVFDRTLTNTLATLGPHPETDSIAISPDGRWVTTGSYHDRSILVWDVADETMVRRLPVGRMPRAVFSGDGKWLATYGDALELRETGTWNLAPPLPFPEGRPALGAATFSPNGRLLAVIADHSTVHLIDLQRFQSVGILRPPVNVNLTGLDFSPDGSKLAAVGVASRAMVWNLENLRRSLARFDLDWDGFEDVGR